MVSSVGNSAICDNLLPAVQYKIGVISKHDSQESIYVNHKTNTKAPMPSTALVDNIEAETATISIGEPKNGEIDNYLLKVTSIPENDDYGEEDKVPERYEYVLPSSTPSTVITQLTPGTKYSVDIFGK